MFKVINKPASGLNQVQISKNRHNNISVKVAPTYHFQKNYTKDAEKLEQTYRVRTITYFSPLGEDPNETLANASSFLQNAKQVLNDDGIEVATVRMGTNTHFDYNKPLPELLEDAHKIDKLVQDNKIVKLCMGPTESPDTLDKLADLKSKTGLVFSYKLPEDLTFEIAKKAAACVLKMASQSDGPCNIGFGLVSNCPTLIPFMPASFTDDVTQPCFSIGLENTGVLPACTKGVDYGDLKQAEIRMREVMNQIYKKIEKNCIEIEKRHGTKFAHIDVSLNPGIDTPPMTDYWKHMGLKRFGDPGTLTICAMITKVLKSLDIKLGGYSGLFLPVNEDGGLADLVAENAYSIGDILKYSAVCGCGLDCIPVPGYGNDLHENEQLENKLAYYIMDTNTLAFKLNKPLVCRFLPVPGRKSGDMTNFELGIIFNSRIMKL